MGDLIGGPYYHLRGRTGNNVGRVVNGKNTFSMRPVPSQTAPTQLQLDQREKFGLTVELLKDLSPLLEIGFQDYTAKMTAFNAAVGYNLKHAITGVSPNFSISYPALQFSQGSLWMPAQVAVVAAAGGLLNYSWKSYLEPNFADATDQVAIIAYNPLRDAFVIRMNAAARPAEEYEMQLPLDWLGEIVHSWMLALSADQVKTSKTAYVGQATVI